MDKVCEACQAAGSSEKAFYHTYLNSSTNLNTGTITRLPGRTVLIDNTHLNVYSKILLNQQDDHEECTKALLELGADVNAECFPGTYVLAQAVERGHVKRLQVLITAGADVNLHNV